MYQFKDKRSICIKFSITSYIITCLSSSGWCSSVLTVELVAQTNNNVLINIWGNLYRATCVRTTSSKGSSNKESKTDRILKIQRKKINKKNKEINNKKMPLISLKKTNTELALFKVITLLLNDSKNVETTMKKKFA